MEGGSYIRAMRWSTLVPTNSQCVGGAMSTTYETVKHGRCARCAVKGAPFPCILDKTEGATRRMMLFRKESGTRSLGTPFTRLSLYRPLFTRSSTSNWYPRCGMGSNGGRSIRRNHSNLCLSPQRKIESAVRGGATRPRRSSSGTDACIRKTAKDRIWRAQPRLSHRISSNQARWSPPSKLPKAVSILKSDKKIVQEHLQAQKWTLDVEEGRKRERRNLLDPPRNEPKRTND